MIHPAPQATLGACRQSQVTQKMNELQEAIDSLLGHIDRLSPALDKVLRSEPPATPKNCVAECPAAEVALASNLSNKIARLREAQQTIESILERLEL